MPVFITGIRGWDSSQGCSSHQFGVDWSKTKLRGITDMTVQFSHGS